MIMGVANVLRGVFTPAEYGQIMLPMVVIKRLHDCLLPTWKHVQVAHRKGASEEQLCAISGYPFYNTGKYTFENLLKDEENIEPNFLELLTGFSPKVREILDKFDFERTVHRLTETGTLFPLIAEFARPANYLGPDQVSIRECTALFETLVRRYTENLGEGAGAYFTSTDLVYLMTDILLTDVDTSADISIYDMAMGTGQMLACAEERILALNPDAKVNVSGQELNPFAYAIAKSDWMIRGGENTICFGNTLSDDQFGGQTFQYCISNPPFGISWKREKAIVEQEHKLGEAGRFAPGLPKITDGQLLFLLNGLSKLNENGRMAIIQNGSSLFAGVAGGGLSEIRRHIIEHDLLESVIQLSRELFMNTEIPVFIWVFSKSKPPERKGKVQLIDASQCFEMRRRNIGFKRREITGTCREMIVQAYKEFKTDAQYGEKDGIHCRTIIVNDEELGYRKIIVERPELDATGKPMLRRHRPVADSSRRTTEKVPLAEQPDDYFRREVLPYAPDAWIDEKRTVVGYEISFSRFFRDPLDTERPEDILAEISELEKSISSLMEGLFAGRVE